MRDEQLAAAALKAVRIADQLIDNPDALTILAAVEAIVGGGGVPERSESEVEALLAMMKRVAVE